MCAYNDTSNKRTIRREWDLPLLNRYRDRIGRRLTYFGLPGPQIHDLLDWDDVLAKHKTGVESPGRTKKERAEADQTIGRLHTNIMVNDLGSGFQLLRANIEDVIINGIDNDGMPPQLNDGAASHLAHFTYDLVNLDFDGGLGYYKEATKTVERVEALKALFARQQGHDFVFLLTINVRDTIDAEIGGYLRGLQTRERGSGWYDLIDWYLTRGPGEREFKLKAAVPSFIRAVAEHRNFRCVCYPPIAYEGHKQAHMLHFAFDLVSQTRSLLAFSAQDDRDLIELPLLRCEKGKLFLPKDQHPGFDPAHGVQHMDFPPDTAKDAILEALI
jgi:hypothetical protein